MWLPVFLSFLIVSCLSLGCQMLDTNDAASPRDVSNQERALAAAETDFGFALFRRVVAAAPDENVLVSPLSASTALGMTLNGARGSTYDELAHALGLPDSSLEVINETYRGLRTLLPDSGDQVTLAQANSAWYRTGLHVAPDYLARLDTVFEALVEALDFQSPSAPDRINAWVSDHTRGTIPSLIERIDPTSQLILLNAVYFKGTWRHEFDSTATAEGPFSNLDGSESRVPFMSMQRSFPLYKSDRFDAIDLPYSDSLFSMTIVLPKDTTALDEVIDGLTAANWASWLGALQPTPVVLALPRFTLERTHALKAPLRAMGVEAAFDPETADLTGMSADADLYVDAVLQKTFLSVDESGTEAAAVTGVIVGATSVGLNEPYLFRVDRPFLLLLREHRTGSVLFAGRVARL